MTSPLVEFLAEKVHDAWVEGEVAAGLVSRKSVLTGEEMLVPFSHLSDRVQESDRRTVRAVLAALSTAGYLIVPAESWRPS